MTVGSMGLVGPVWQWVDGCDVGLPVAVWTGSTVVLRGSVVGSGCGAHLPVTEWALDGWTKLSDEQEEL
ncbi:hypothetical protein E2562_013034 [Oryza meyeriana var. granulata]|uniref:Uncharacterized protein n=1 Tax=Oryza meyeriana var. granulata TaxID=110450 RepID=A0A6G1DIS7_9ORYZ|nr:hypothetical protein E2562_013034 [Oryza meyeriana var. granulata]